MFNFPDYILCRSKAPLIYICAPCCICALKLLQSRFLPVKGVARSVTRPQLCAASWHRSSDWFDFFGPQLNCLGSDFLILSVLFTHEQNCRQLFPVIESSLTNPLYPAEDKVCNLLVDTVVRLTAGAKYFPPVSSGGEKQTVLKKRVCLVDLQSLKGHLPMELDIYTVRCRVLFVECSFKFKTSRHHSI